MEHNDRFMVFPGVILGGLAHCWVLRRHRLVFFLAAPGLDRLTHPEARVSVWVGVVVVVVGWGVVVC